MKFSALVLLITTLAATGCHPGPVINTGGALPVGGTIAGIVSTESKIAVPTRKVTAIDVSSGARFEATTGVNGGYTIKVPQGTYRLELELREGEKLTRTPENTSVNRSDLDAQRDFVITVARRP